MVLHFGYVVDGEVVPACVFLSVVNVDDHVVSDWCSCEYLHQRKNVKNLESYVFFIWYSNRVAGKAKGFLK